MRLNCLLYHAKRESQPRYNMPDLYEYCSIGSHIELVESCRDLVTTKGKD